MNSAHIRLENASVSFPVFDAGNETLRSAVVNKLSLLRGKPYKRMPVVVHALEDISITISPGESVGLIGPNGAGKSTLLRLLSRVYVPSSGVAEIVGSQSTLLDLVNGMDSNATGWDNILLRGLALGYTRREMKSAMTEIADFSGLDEALALPVRTYSSGMLVRLAFSICTAMPRDVVLIDEVVGAGDSNFMIKANERLSHFIDSSSILVLASHSEETLRKFCNRGIVLMNGKVSFDGDIESALSFYAGS